MLRRVVIASEVSPSATFMLHQLKNFHGIGTDECLLLYCQEQTEALPDEGQIAEQKALLESFGYKVEVRKVTGFFKDEMNKIAGQEGYSYIVSQKVDKSLLKDYYTMESGFERPHHADKPVLFVPAQKIMVRKGIDTIHENPLENILFATDFSVNASLAFEYMKQIAQKAQKIRILHVQDKRKFDSYTREQIAEFNEIDEGRLFSMKETLQENGCPDVEYYISVGLPSDVIISFIHDHAISLIVMGSQGRGYEKRKVIGSVSQAITKEVDVPVLLIPARSEG